MTRLLREAGCRRHTVQAGETLAALAQRFEISPWAIALLNDLHADRLTPDQVLIICAMTPFAEPAEPVPLQPPAELGQPIDVVMNITYPRKIRNRKPQWIRLVVDVPRTIGGTGTPLLPDVTEVETLERVTLPAPPSPRLPRTQTAMLVEQWVVARLTGPHLMSRAETLGETQPLSRLLNQSQPLVWQWLFMPPTAGDYLFGLDVYTRGEFEILNTAGEMVGTAEGRRIGGWMHDFVVRVDEIFGIPRQWWLIASGAGALLNLALGILQLMRGA